MPVLVDTQLTDMRKGKLLFTRMVQRCISVDASDGPQGIVGAIALILISLYF